MPKAKPLSEDAWIERQNMRDQMGLHGRRIAIPHNVRFKILMRDRFRCIYCGLQSTAEGVVLCVDHIKPHSKGGLNTPENLITCCQLCNLGKNDIDMTGQMPE